MPVTATRCSSTLPPLPGVRCKEGLVPEPEQYRLFEFKGSDGSFLKKVGIKPCVIHDPCPQPLQVPVRKERHIRFTGKDAEWLRECGVAWEQKPVVQLPLDFCGRQEAVQET
jgi:hypothetical protein